MASNRPEIRVTNSILPPAREGERDPFEKAAETGERPVLSTMHHVRRAALRSADAGRVGEVERIAGNELAEIKKGEDHALRLPDHERATVRPARMRVKRTLAKVQSAEGEPAA